MSEFPYLPLFTDAFLADTGHLPARETGAYLLLLMVAWRTPTCSLPDDDAKLARWARVDGRTWKNIKADVMAFWDVVDGFWTQKRLLKEREIVSKRAAVARTNGATGGRPKSLKNNGAENPAGSCGETQKKPPIPIPIKEEESLLRKDAGASPDDTPEKLLFRRGKQVLGKNAGGMIASLLKAKGSVPLAAAVIEIASTKESPREYVAACSRGPPSPFPMNATQQRNQEWHNARQKVRDFAYRDESGSDSCGPSLRLLPSVGGK